MTHKKRVAILFHRFGPYHKVRVESCADSFDVLAVELSRSTAEYAWDSVAIEKQVQSVTVCTERDSRETPAKELYLRIDLALKTFQPDVVLVNGWTDNGAVQAMRWCDRNRVPVVMMSETNQQDFKRSAVKEMAKRMILSNVSAALAGGTLARLYLESLGVASHRVAVGYDIVDNRHFTKPVGLNKEVLREQLGLQRPYFLVCSRMIPKKNLGRLIAAYADYRIECEEPYDLVIIGDGPLQQQVRNQIESLGLADVVNLVGFLQYDEIPPFYWAAEALVHPSTIEQWGLVVNEAMAAGLPCLVSDRCGCVTDLVQPSVTGETFNPFDSHGITSVLTDFTNAPADVVELMGVCARQQIEAWSPRRFCLGVQEAVQVAVKSPRRRSLMGRASLWVLGR